MPQNVFLFFFINGDAKEKLFLLLNGTQYASPKLDRTQYASLNEAVRSTQWGRGVTLIFTLAILKMKYNTCGFTEVNILLIMS